MNAALSTIEAKAARKRKPARVANCRFEFNAARAEVVAEKIMRAYTCKSKVFRKEGLFPEEALPKGMEMKSIEHARYLFLMNQLDHSVSSKTLYQYGRSLAEARPLLFDRGHAFTNAELNDVVRKWLHYPFVEKSVHDLKHNFEEINAEFGGNPINVFDGMRDVGEALLQLERFKGYGPNLSRLLISYYIRSGLVRFENGTDFLPKIDIHDIRISVSTGVIRIDRKVGKDKIIPVLSRFWSDFCKKHGYCIIELDRAIWAIGSEVCNKKDRRACVRDCPVEAECGSMPPSYYNDGLINPHVDDRPPQLALKLSYEEDDSKLGGTD